MKLLERTQARRIRDQQQVILIQERRKLEVEIEQKIKELNLLKGEITRLKEEKQFLHG